MPANGKFPLCIEGIDGRHDPTQNEDIYQSNALIYHINLPEVPPWFIFSAIGSYAD